MNPILNALRGRHQLLQEKIDAEQQRPRPDALRLRAIKKLKLFFRDKIELVDRAGRNKPPVVVVTRRAIRRMMSSQAG